MEPPCQDQRCSWTRSRMWSGAGSTLPWPLTSLCWVGLMPELKSALPDLGTPCKKSCKQHAIRAPTITQQGRQLCIIANPIICLAQMCCSNLRGDRADESWAGPGCEWPPGVKSGPTCFRRSSLGLPSSENTWCCQLSAAPSPACSVGQGCQIQ